MSSYWKIYIFFVFFPDGRFGLFATSIRQCELSTENLGFLLIAKADLRNIKALAGDNQLCARGVIGWTSMNWGWHLQLHLKMVTYPDYYMVDVAVNSD